MKNTSCDVKYFLWKTFIFSVTTPFVIWSICTPSVLESNHLGHLRACFGFENLRATLAHVNVEVNAGNPEQLPSKDWKEQPTPHSNNSSLWKTNIKSFTCHKIKLCNSIIPQHNCYSCLLRRGKIYSQQFHFWPPGQSNQTMMIGASLNGCSNICMGHSHSS
jgi:hypothetical protein